MLDDLVRELAESLEAAIEYIDCEGPHDDEYLDEEREAVLERSCDILSCYRHKDYEVCDGEVIWPDEDTRNNQPTVRGAEEGSTT